MITYETFITIRVKLDGKVTGEIKPVGTKFAYFPKGSKDHGDLFSTVAEVKKSLEEE